MGHRLGTAAPPHSVPPRKKIPNMEAWCLSLLICASLHGGYAGLWVALELALWVCGCDVARRVRPKRAVGTPPLPRRIGSAYFEAVLQKIHADPLRGWR